MKKIPCLFIRNYETGELTTEINPECQWVANGFGVPSRKFDGSACLVKDGLLYRRYDAKAGKPWPDGFIPAQEACDALTGHFPGWILVGLDPQDKWHMQALSNQSHLFNGTYELIGPKVQSDAEREYRMAQQNDERMHILVPHGNFGLADWPRTREYLMLQLASLDIEGIVWHHPDGRMCKITKKALGLERKPV